VAESLRIVLPHPYPVLTVVEHIDHGRGSVRYLVSGRRVAGVFVVEPSDEPEKAVPTRVCVRYGDGPAHHHRDYDRTDQPVVNGIDLVGGTILDPHDAPFTRSRLHIRRPTSISTSTSVPDKTGDYVAAIITALLQRWRALPERRDLMLAAARRTAQSRLHDIQHWRLPPLYQRRDQLAAEIRDVEYLVGDLTDLAETYANERTSPASQ
jgi:hypothetical protein